jgi:2-polyprenyl-3-methyl-5-hydroxy-6-metoxy-1,4-benzoquinol methylase
MKPSEWRDFQKKEYVDGGSWGVTSRSLDADRFEFARRILFIERKPLGIVIDLGCGDASFSREIAKKGYSVVAVDLPEAVKKMAVVDDDKEVDMDWTEAWGLKPGDVGFVGCDLESVALYPPEMDWTADAIVALEVLEHLVYDFDLARHMCQWLKPGGILVLTVPNNDTGCLPYEHHLRSYTPRSITKLLCMAGFPVKDISVAVGPSSLLVKAVK